MIDKPPEYPGQQAIAATAAHVVVPYTVEKLREQTMTAVMEWGGDHTFYALDPTDDYAYARVLMDWWERHQDLVVIEQDIVPAPGMIDALLACAEAWCGYPYHVGEGRYTYGLGLCKIAATVMARHPALGMLAMRDHRGRICAQPWPAVNEALERQMTRCGYTMHHHEGVPVHLHYPIEQARGD